ncbi:hypothetical protein VSDG_07459 [Cytospora chrysosperma]|uniref:Uncharacterized protein n=1 Tax=Cytospora chrysosperma TaxID=252740 RepID=A0A423VHY1_CYTCH|nr:hypothetical protein VSDG_07459 [Valsa sordida]
MPAFVRQVVEMRYTDTEILAQELDQRLGLKNWKCEVFASRIVLKLSRALSSVRPIIPRLDDHHS